MKSESLNKMSCLFENMTSIVIDELKDAILESENSRREKAAEPKEGNAFNYPTIVLKGARELVVACLEDEHAQFVGEQLDEAISYLEYVSTDPVLEE